MTDSPRWCAVCNAYGDHHTDKHPSAPAVTQTYADRFPSRDPENNERRRRLFTWGISDLVLEEAFLTGRIDQLIQKREDVRSDLADAREKLASLEKEAEQWNEEKP